MSLMEDFVEHIHPDSMYGDDLDDIYLDAEHILSQLTPEERQQLLKHYQNYHEDNLMPADWQSDMLPAGDNGAFYESMPDVLDDGDDYGAYEDYDYYDQDQYPGYYPDEEFTRISFSELCDRCIFPTFSQAVTSLFPLLLLCLLVRIAVYVSSEVLTGSSVGRYCDWRSSMKHVVSASCGVVALYVFFEETLVYLVTLAPLSYLLLYLTRLKCTQWSGKAVAITTVIYLLACELFVVPSSQWHRIRGAQMVLAMKIISVGFDLDSRLLSSMPSPLEFAGYLFNVGTVIFGPWVSFAEYSNSLLYKDRKLSFYWLAKCLKCGVFSLLCVTISTCITHWLILDEEAFVWLLAYRDAQSFRFSHYFISYASELTATLSGLGASKINGDLRWDLSVSKPLYIELPRSLVEVVSNWNLPMHFWLKTYVFKTAKPLGNFAAILLTYIASSILHGLNFQLAAVLLSLGFYSYIEHVLRHWLSRVFDACVQAKTCKEHCDHANDRGRCMVRAVNVDLGALALFHFRFQGRWMVRAVNLGLGALALFHLSYLGLMFDNSGDQEEGYSMGHTLRKWSLLGYASHWLALGTYLFYLLI